MQRATGAVKGRGQAEQAPLREGWTPSQEGLLCTGVAVGSGVAENRQGSLTLSALPGAWLCSECQPTLRMSNLA